MKVPKCFTLYILTLFGIMEAFRFESKPPDGIYTINKDENGNDFTEYLGPLDRKAGEESEVPSPEDRVRYAPHIPEIDCTGIALPITDTLAAYDALKEYCGDGKYVETSVVFVAGNTVAYACHRQNTSVCTELDASRAYETAFSVCGEGRSSRWIPWGDPVMMYGYDSVSWDICCDDMPKNCPRLKGTA